jgi:hypothetical protein
VNRFIVYLLVLILAACPAFAQRHLNIVRLTQEPKIDGQIDDAAWQGIEFSTGFTQTVPSPDQPSEYRSEVKVAYTNQSIFIAAKLYQPSNLHSLQLSPRDGLNRINADVFSVFLDTYNDHQNGFAFRVSSKGVQQEERLFEGDEYGDISWDAVWNSATQIQEDAWTVEIEIPFSALRFSEQKIQSWGINFLRMVRAKNESSYWNPVNPQKQGFLAQSGVLDGLDNIQPPLRLFLFPYLSTGYFSQPLQGQREHRWLKSGGLDVKYGINESFTLDLTLIPDFSQVISDNVIRNLSPFEQQLTENRPFFTEGTELFNKLGLLYSRRIGAQPEGYHQIRTTYGDTAQFEIERNPNISSLYNSFKISGRTKQKTGIGIFNALGAPAYARIRDKQSGQRFLKQTEGLNNFNVFVLDQTLKGQSFVNFTNTNVYRNNSQTIANVSAIKWNHFFRSETMVFSVFPRISAIQNLSKKWFTGSAVGIEQSKISGRFRYTIGVDYLSPQYDQSDLGIQFDYNNSKQFLQLAWRENKPKSPRLQLYEINTTHQWHWNTEPYSFKFYQAELSTFLLFKNFWDMTFSLESKPFAPIDYYQFRSFGKKLKLFPYLFGSYSGSSDSRKKLFWSYYFGYGHAGEPHTAYIYTEQGLRYRFGQKLEVNLTMWYKNDQSNLGYATFNSVINEPIAGRRDVKENSGEISLKLNLSPLMNFTGRFRHYHSRIRYISLHTLSDDGSWKNNIQNSIGGLDENYNLQNVDVFFNWMFRPGSRIVLSYKQWLNDAYILNEQRDNSYYRNVSQIIRQPKAFELNARVIFFLDYNTLRKKKNI